MDLAPKHRHNETKAHKARGVRTMTTIDRIRARRDAKREARAIERAWKAAPTQSMRNEIAIFSQQRVF